MKLHEVLEKLPKPTPDETRQWALATKMKHGLEAFDVWQTSSGDIKLNLLVVPKGMRSEGRGSAAMDDLIRYADRYGFRLLVSPAVKDDRMGTTSRSRLIKFYKRFGYKENKGRNKDFTVMGGMIRPTKT